MSSNEETPDQSKLRESRLAFLAKLQKAKTSEPSSGENVGSASILSSGQDVASPSESSGQDVASPSESFSGKDVTSVTASDKAAAPEDMATTSAYHCGDIAATARVCKNQQAPTLSTQQQQMTSIVFNFFAPGQQSGPQPFAFLEPLFRSFPALSGKASQEVKQLEAAPEPSPVIELAPEPSPVIELAPEPEPVKAEVVELEAEEYEVVDVADCMVVEEASAPPASPDFAFLCDFNSDDDDIDDPDDDVFLPPRSMKPILPRAKSVRSGPSCASSSVAQAGPSSSVAQGRPASSSVTQQDLRNLLQRAEAVSPRVGAPSMAAPAVPVGALAAPAVPVRALAAPAVPVGALAAPAVPVGALAAPAVPVHAGGVAAAQGAAGEVAAAQGAAGEVAVAQGAAGGALEEDVDLPPGFACSVCLTGRFEVILRCKHMFCRRCVLRMMQTRPSKCALCSRNFRKFENCSGG